MFVLLPVVLDEPVEDLDELVDVAAAANGVPDELEGVGDRDLQIVIGCSRLTICFNQN